jgi:DNA replication protein DnaC
MTTSADDALDREAEAEARRRSAALREAQAVALGGRRALEVYVAEAFVASPRTAPALAAAQAFDPAKDNLYFHGPTGTGKSWLAAVAARRHLPAHRFPGGHVRTLTEMAMARMARSCPDAAAEEALVRELGETPVLVLQDLGVAKVTEFLAALVFEVVDYRYQNRPGGLVVTSNLGLGDLGLKLGDDRVADRLAQMTRGNLFNFAGEASRRVPPKEGA